MQVGHDARMIRPVPDGRLEDDALIVAFALAFRLDAVGTRRPLFATFDSPFAAIFAAQRLPRGSMLRHGSRFPENIVTSRGARLE